MRARWLPVLLLSAGCSVAPLEEESFQAAKNHCSSDADCGEGTCDASLGLCKASQGQFSTVLFEITPPTNAKSWSDLGFIVPTDVSPSGGPLDLSLGAVSKVTGSVTPSGFQGGCMYGANNENAATAPVKVTFTPSTRILGLGSKEYVATTSYNPKTQQFEFSLSVPPDEYDVYIASIPNSPDVLMESCSIVPQLLHGVVVDGAKPPDLPIALQTPKPLHVDVVLPGKAASPTQQMPLAGWSVEVVDPVRGLLLSVPMELAYTKDWTDPDNQHYLADVYFTEAQGGQALAGMEIVRVKPPAGVVAPTLAIERAVLELLKPGEAKVSALTALPKEKTLDQLSLYDADGKPLDIPASVRFVSSKLDLEGWAEPGIFAFYETKVEATHGVTKSVPLLPGEYEVLVTPKAGLGYASTRATLTIGTSGIQGGKAVTVEVVSSLGGSVLIPSGSEAATGAAVQAAASPVAPTPQEIAVAAVLFAPQSTSGLVGNSGQFLLEADPGTFDFSVRPAEGSRFAWLVRPNVDVQSGQHDLGPMTLPLPVVYQGSVTVPNPDASAAELTTPVPGSLIRAFIYLNESGYTTDRAGAKAVVQIAETRARDDGSFDLFLPAQLN